MKLTRVVVVNVNGTKIEFTWLGRDNLSDKHMLMLHIERNFKNVSHSWRYDQDARGWELV